MNAAEVELIGEKTPIKIIPNFAHDKLYLIAGDVGPFQPGIPIEVPLWLGINLKQRGRCRLVPLSWMDIEVLTNKKTEETSSQLFTEMPCEHYLVVSQLYLSVGADDVPNSQKIKTLIKDIWDLRMAKLNSSVAAFIKTEATHAKLTYLTLYELNSIRPLLPHSLNQLDRLAKGAKTVNASGNNTSVSFSA